MRVSACVYIGRERERERTCTGAAGADVDAKEDGAERGGVDGGGSGGHFEERGGERSVMLWWLGIAEEWS